MVVHKEIFMTLDADPGKNPPTVPANLNAVNVSEIDLTWTASTDNVGVTNYLIEREDPGGASFTQIGTTSVTTFSDTSLPVSGTYSYRVRATDAAGNISDYSNVVTATIQLPDTTPPTAPTDLTATTISKIDLTWTPSTDNVDVASYLVEREDPGSSSFAQIGTISVTAFNDTSLTSGGTYSYRVRATDTAGNASDYSNTVSITVS